MLCGSTVGYPNDSLASCFYHASVFTHALQSALESPRLSLSVHRTLILRQTAKTFTTL